MARVICEVTDGLRKSEATVKITTFDGRPEFLPVDRGLLSQENGVDYLSVPIIHKDEPKQAALIALPVEADSGAHRVWVRFNQLKQDQKVLT